MSKRTRDYYLGILVGKYIISNDLPTLSTDMLKTHRVIQVPEEETKEHERLYSEWVCGEKDEDGVNEHWKPHLEYMYYLGEKYLPKELVSRVPKFGLEFVESMDELKEGIRDALWNSDVCWYNIDSNDDVEIKKTDDLAWCEVITLKLKIDIGE